MGLTLVNDPSFPAPYSTSICGFCVSSRLPSFSASRRHSYTRFSNSPRNNVGVVFFLWFLPDWCTIKMQWMLFRRTLFCVVFCSVVTGCASPLLMILGVHMLSRMFLLYFAYWLPTSRGPTLALQSLTLSTWRQHFRVERLLNPPSGVLIVSAGKAGVVSPGS